MIIVFVGKIGSGKSSAANILKKYSFVEETFADPIKQFLITLGFKHDEVYGSQEDKARINEFWNVSGREFMQKFGTDLMRNKLQATIPNLNLNNSTVWVRIMEKKLQNNHKNIVIGDGRFPDEIALIKKYGGIVVKINRCVCDSEHESESYINSIVPDYEIMKL
jgi:hypothetical protein